MELYYINSKNEKLDFMQAPYLIKNIDGLRNYEWNFQEENGRITRFTKNICQIPISVNVLADTKEEYCEACNRFYSITEHDVISNQRGSLFYNGQYCPCNLITSNKVDWNMGIDFAILDVTFVTDNPVWTTETMQEFHVSAVTAGSTKKYPYRYPYRYSSNAGTGYLVNDNFTDSNFMLRIYGPVSSPKITIGGYSYCIYDSVAQGEYIRANSRDNTIVKVSESGVETNIFHKRQKDTKFFKKISPGMLEVDWTGTYPFDITLYKERSEPVWE